MIFYRILIVVIIIFVNSICFGEIDKKHEIENSLKKFGIISSISNCTTLGKIPVGGNQSGKEVQTNEHGRARMTKNMVTHIARYMEYQV